MTEIQQLMPHLPYLSAVWKHGSFTAAAMHMKITQAAVSYQIKQLEEKLGVQLIVRQSGSKPALTASALSVLETYNKAEVQLRHALEGATSDPTTGTFRLSVPVDFGSLVMPWVIAELKKSAPNLQVELQVTDAVTDLLQDGFDCAIRATSDDKRLTNQSLFTSRAVLVCSRAYAATNDLPQRIEHLLNHCLLLRKRLPSSNLSRLLSKAAIDPAEVNKKIVLGNTFALVEAVRAGLGIGLLPQFSLQGDLSSGELVEIELIEQEAFQSQFYMSFPHLPQNIVRIKLLQDALCRALARLHFKNCFDFK